MDTYNQPPRGVSGNKFNLADDCKKIYLGSFMEKIIKHMEEK